MNRARNVLAAITLSAVTCLGVHAVEQRPYLTLQMAKMMADACEAKAAAEGWRKVNIAIYDDGGNLKLFRRQDGSFLHSIEIAQLKARTSAGVPRSTREMGDIAYGDPQRPHGIQMVPGFVVFAGGLPIMTTGGAQIGGIGVSGATSDQDETCARVALEAIAEELK